jgi:Bacterial PH domain
VSSQHDEAPARRDEPAPPNPPGQSGGGVAPSDQAPSPVSFDAAAVGPDVASAPGFGQAGPVPGTGTGQRTPWKAGADGRTVFRRGTPFVVWWVWVAFAIFNLAEIAIPDHDYFSLEFTAGVLLVTAVMYACTLRPRVLAGDDGVTVLNPFQDHRIRWGALNGVFLGDSVELGCARPAPKKEKTVYCWALYSGRRSRLKAQVRSERGRGRVYGAGAARRAQAEAQDLARQDIVQLMAAEIGRRSTAAKERGVPDAVLESTWAWLPLVYVVVPAALLIGLVLGR